MFLNRVFGVGFYYFKDLEVDGIIYVIVFGCGFDVIVGRFL